MTDFQAPEIEAERAWLRLILRRYEELQTAEGAAFGPNVKIDWGGRCGREMSALFSALARATHTLGVDGGQPAPPAPPGTDMPANSEPLSALRSAEARGRVQGLREAAEDAVLPDVAAWLRRRADAIEQEQK